VWRSAPLGARFSVAGLVIGLALHMMMSMLLGMVAAVGVRSSGQLAANPAALAMTGVVFGIVVWAVMQYALWRAVDPAAALAFTWVFAIGHVMFGAVTALLVGTGSARPEQAVLHAPATPV
jgi:hypothetical protein